MPGTRKRGFLLSFAMAACLMVGAMGTRAETGHDVRAFPILVPPPEIDRLHGLAPSLPASRESYRSRVAAAAEKMGLPAALAEAVAFVESGFRADARGLDGEVGLMQILPSTAAMLGHDGTLAELFDPEVNIKYGVTYLAKAWQLAGGDLCRALMKYRAGHGEERMSELSVRYCARARAHLASIGSPLATSPGAVSPALGHALAALAVPTPSRQRAGRPGRPRTQAVSRRFWAAHEARIRAINAKLTASRLRVMSRT
jgi:hypothetical protein